MGVLRQRLAEETARVLRERGLTINAASIRLGIERQTLTRMHNGLPPRLEVVERFARGLELDVNDWRALAGYDRLETPVGETPAERLGIALDDLRRRYGLDRLVVKNFGGSGSLTHSDVDRIIRE